MSCFTFLSKFTLLVRVIIYSIISKCKWKKYICFNDIFGSNWVQKYFRIIKTTYIKSRVTVNSNIIHKIIKNQVNTGLIF